MADFDLSRVISGCIDGNGKSQEMFYRHFYGYAMSACLTYANNKEDALEIMHDGFMKIFKNIHLHDDKKSIKGWVRRIMVNTAIDHYRKNLKHQKLGAIDTAKQLAVNAAIYDKISAEEIIELVQELSPAYRMVFNLFVIEGYSHKEIAAKLHIAESTSRSNLVMANKKLRRRLNERMLQENA